MIHLRSGAAQADVMPDIGGALASLAVGGRAVLRPWSGNPADGPFALASNLLLPFSNRISGGGFVHDGRHHALSPNLPGERFPIHGDGFQRVWAVTEQSADSATLTLDHGQFGPFRYRAKVLYRLGPDRLTITLTLTNTADRALPHGVGFHPWFPRDAETRLQFTAAGIWPETADHLPATLAPLALAGGGGWHRAAPLPEGWINAAFSGWTGEATVLQGQRFASARITATGLTTAMVYSPSSLADFLCFEPVSHPVDAHNLPGHPGLVTLGPDEGMTVGMTLIWDA